MGDKSLSMDETSKKYVAKSTKWITSRFIDNIIEEIDGIGPESILDVGCGTGYVSGKIERSTGIEVLGCDISRDRLSIAKKNVRGGLLMADATRLPFEDSSFDLVVASEILEHLSDPVSSIEEIGRVSKRYVMVTVPNEPFFRMANFFRGKNLRRFGNPHDHIHHFNEKSLGALLSEHFSDVVVGTNAFLWLIGVGKK
jgi:SAM-dependent methyltransferase